MNTNQNEHYYDVHQEITCSQRQEYAQEEKFEEIFDGYDTSFAQKQGIATTECITPNSKIQKPGVPVTNEKEQKPKSLPPETVQDMVDHEEGLKSAESDLITYHESCINTNGDYDDLCPQCDTHTTFCHGKIFTSFSSTYTYQQFHLAPLSWSRRTATYAYTKAYNRALDYILFKEKGKLLVKAKFFPPACMKHDLDETIDKIEADLEEMREEQMTVKTYKCLDNEKPLQNHKEELEGEINPHIHGEEELEEMAQDSNRCPGCLLLKHQCHNVLFGSYCKEKVIRSSDLFPSAMICPSAEDVFITKYQFALTVHIFWRFNILISEARFTYPKRCLLDNMKDTCDFIEQKHNVYKSSKAGKVNISELKESAMDYNGNDPDKV